MHYSTKKNISSLIEKISFFLLITLFLSAFILYKISHSTIGTSNLDKYFMEMAYEEAKLALDSCDVPVGAIIVINGRIIAKAHNLVKLTEDYRAHAEMLAINDALKILNISDFEQIKVDIVLYTTYEPCAMCEGFIVSKKVPRVVVGKRKNFVKLLKENYLGHILYRLNERGGFSEKIQKQLFKKHELCIK